MSTYSFATRAFVDIQGTVCLLGCFVWFGLVCFLAMRPRFRTADGGYPFPVRSQTRVPAALPIREARVRVTLGSPSTRTPFLHLSPMLMQTIPGLLSSPTALLFSLALPGPGPPVVTHAHPAFSRVVPFWLEAPLAGFTLSIEALYSSSIIGVAGITEQSFLPSFVTSGPDTSPVTKWSSTPSFSDSFMRASKPSLASESIMSPDRRSKSIEIGQPSASPRLNRSLSGSSVHSSSSLGAKSHPPLPCTSSGTLHVSLVNTETSKVLTSLAMEFLIARPLPGAQPELPRLRARCHSIALYHLHVQLSSDGEPIVHKDITVRSVPFPLSVSSVPRTSLCPPSKQSEAIECCSMALDSGTLMDALSQTPMTLSAVLMSLPENRHAIVELVLPDKFSLARSAHKSPLQNNVSTEAADIRPLKISSDSRHDDSANSDAEQHEVYTDEESLMATNLVLPDLNRFADAVIGACLGRVAALVARDPDLCTLLAMKQTTLPVFCRVPKKLERDMSSSLGSSSSAPLLRSSERSSGLVLPNPRISSVDAASSFAQSVGLRGLVVNSEDLSGAKGESRLASARNCGLAVIADLCSSHDFADPALDDTAEKLHVDGAIACNGVSTLSCVLFSPGEVESASSDEEGDFGCGLGVSPGDSSSSSSSTSSSLEARSPDNVDSSSAGSHTCAHHHSHHHYHHYHHHHHHHHHGSNSGEEATLVRTKSVSWNDPVVTPPRIAEDYEADSTIL